MDESSESAAPTAVSVTEKAQQSVVDRMRSAELSARLHAMRAAFFEGAVRERDEQLAMIRRSSSWRLTAPMRLFIGMFRDGPSKTIQKINQHLIYRWQTIRDRWGRKRASSEGEHGREIYDVVAACKPQALIAPRVLIVAELSLAQCAKYRVWQRQEHFRQLGTPCTVLKWQNIAECRSALQTHIVVIFYRVPGFEDALSLMKEARRLRLTSYWEVDDLIFDTTSYLANRNLDSLDPQLRSEVLSGVTLFQKGMLACDCGIASTPALAVAMRGAGMADVLVVSNALDDETKHIAHEIRVRAEAIPRAAAEQKSVVIGYGSGSKAHNADFLEASPAIASLLNERPDVQLQVMGELELPADLDVFANRVRRFTSSNYKSYLEWLVTCDVSLAPLERSAFNEAKSNIKYIEASILRVPSVCSPRQAFHDVIEEGKTGFLADTTEEWYSALSTLVDSAKLRKEIGLAAEANVLSRFADGIAERQLRPIIAGLDQRKRKKITVLVVNIFFAPKSYGGATIVAEEMSRRLTALPDVDVFVFASNSLPGEQAYTLRRYSITSEYGDLPVFSVRLPPNFGDPITGFDDPQMVRSFCDVLAAVEPDIVHFHCLQGLSSAILDACHDQSIPFVVSVHDAWWLCERQFMVRANGQYCGQTRIDLRVCEGCVPGAQHLRERFQMSMQRLSGADRLLFPSEFHRNLHVTNGFNPGKCIVNKNGVRAPGGPRLCREPGPLRFGYVGGNDRIKGFHLIMEAFEKLHRNDYGLTLVDNTTNAGYSSMRTEGWHLTGDIRIVPGYRQETMDAFFQGIDVLLFPSQWKESFGLTVREALLRDVWVIATDGGGAVEDIVHNENGTIIAFDCSADDLRRAIIAMLEQPSRLYGHINLFKDRIATYDLQASELHQILSDVVQSRVYN